MPIRVACSSCGKKLQVRDELAGKKVKCPGCGIAFAAVAQDGGGTGIKASAPKVAPPGTKDKVSTKPMAKKPPPPPMDDDDDQNDEDFDERPVSKRKKGKQASGGGSKLWLWLSLAGVLVLGGGAAVYFIFFYGPPTNTGPIVQNKDKGKGGDPITPPIVTPPENPGPGTSASLADLVPGDAMFFVSFSGDLYTAKALDGLRPMFAKEIEGEFSKAMGFGLGDLDRITMMYLGTFAELAQNNENGYVALFQSKKPFDQAKVRNAVQTGPVAKNPNLAIEFINAQTMALTPKAGLQAYNARKGKTKATGVMERGLAQASNSRGLVLAGNIPPEAAQLGEQALKDAPPFFAAFLKTKAVLASVDLTDRLSLKAALILENEAAATEAKQAVDGLVGLAGLMLSGMAKDMPDLAKLGQQALKDLKIATKGNELNVAFEADVGQIADKVMPIIMKLKGAAGNVQESNNLKQIGLAFHIHHDVYKSLPPQTVGKGLSWRVAILPFIEQDNLYKMFKLDEPWDSPANKKLIPLMPKTFESVGRKAPPGFTYYQSFVGPNTINANPMKGLTFAQFRDGTTNTVVAAEAAVAVEWTKPADIQVAPNQPIALGSSDGKTTWVLKADASIERIPLTLDQKTLRSLIDPADGR